MTQKPTVNTSLISLFALVGKIAGSKTGKKLAKNWGGKIALVLGGIAATATPAHALKINTTYSSEVDLNTAQIINDIASIWEEELKDPVTINLNFSFDNTMPTGILGGSKPGMIKVNYKDYLTVLGQDAISPEDVLAVKTKLTDSDDLKLFNKYLNGEIERRQFKVKDTKTFDLLIDETFDPNSSSGNGNGRLDDNDNNNNKKIWLTRSNAKALNLLKADDNKLDASIVLSNAVNWDMDSSNGVSSDAYDFRTVVLHEIGHALGFVSGADAVEYLNASSSDNLTDDDLSYVTPLSTYVYSDESKNSKVIDLRVGQGIEKYMSLDGGTTKVTNAQGDVALFSQGGLAVGGDGYQTSHWKNSATPLGIMTPTLQMGQSLDISDLDFKLLDAIGWDLTSRARQLMTDVGLDWDDFQTDLAEHGEYIIGIESAIWGFYNPGETIEDELRAELHDLYKDIEPQIEEELQALKDYLDTEGDWFKRWDKWNEVIDNVFALIGQQNELLSVYATNVRDVDTEVRSWLNKDVKGLSGLLKNANRVQIHTLQKILANAPEDQRLLWEDKIQQALALFLENPDKALEQIAQTNDFHGPMDGGSGSSGTGGGWWGGWWSSSVTKGEDLDFYNYDTASETNTAELAQSVPEPSTIISLLALSGVGLLTRQRRN